MTRDEAELRAAELNREQPGFRWLAHERDGVWGVARLSLPAGIRLDPLKQGVETRSKPEAPDPRSAHARDVGGLYGPG